jgi:F-type H+-transporting ATPase subunit b
VINKAFFRNSWVKFTGTAVVLAIPFALAASFGNSADEHAAASEGLPTAVILQFVNFFLYIGLIVYFARRPISEYFKNRQANFFSALKRADAARAEAQAKRTETQARLAKLESSRDESIQTARTEAAALRTQIVDEAKALSEKLKIDAQRTAHVEIERAKMMLREELVNQSVAMAQRILSDKMQEQDQKRLQDEFVKKIDQNAAVTA